MDAQRNAPGTEGRQMAGMLEKLDQLRRVLSQSSSINTSQMRLMWLFSDRIPRTLRQISDELQIEQSTANRQANTALAHGLLARHRETAGTPYLFHATERGISEYERNLDNTLNVYRAALAALGVDKDHFKKLMEVFVHAFESELKNVTTQPAAVPLDDAVDSSLHI